MGSGVDVTWRKRGINRYSAGERAPVVAQTADQSEASVIPKKKQKKLNAARSTGAMIDPASFPLEFDPGTYRSLHSDLWYMPDEQLRQHYQTRGKAEGRRAHPLQFREEFRDL